MSSRTKGRSGTHGEAGYAVLMAVFMVATLLLLVAAISPSVLIQGRREREQDAVWRGNQYVRAVRLYYQKNGRFPLTLEDLTKAGPSGVHFLRKTYTDPMNRDDGTWRAIYVSPSGQLIGSVRYHSLQEMAAAKGFAVGSSVPASSVPNATAQPSGQPPAGQQPSSGFGMSSLQPSAPVPLEAVDGPVLGGSVIGVGGKTKKASLLVYDGGTTYFQWEFIYNPLATANGQLPGVTSPAAGAALGIAGQPGATAPPGTSANPQSGNPAQIPNPTSIPPLANPPPATDIPQPNPAP